MFASRIVDSAAVVFCAWDCKTATADCNRLMPDPLPAREAATASMAALIVMSEGAAEMTFSNLASQCSASHCLNRSLTVAVL